MSFGLVNTGHKGLNGNKKVGRLWKASSAVIPSIHANYFRGLSKDGEEWQATLSGRYIPKERNTGINYRTFYYP